MAFRKKAGPNGDAGGWYEGPAQAREQVFALLSHEIRTPLNGVIGMAGLLAGTSLDATQTAYLTTLQDCADHLLGLVNDVLDLAKLDAGRIELEPTPTDVEHLLQGVCELLSPRAHSAGLEIGWSVGPDVPPLNVDDGRLRQILFNLAGNAVKLTRTGGVLVTAEVVAAAAAEPRRPHVRFTVSDTGPGLDPADSARIFEAVVEADVGERAGGAGLGLAIVKRLADACDGQVGVESRLGEGARFWFEAQFEAAGPAEPKDELAGLRIHLDTPSAIVREAAAAQLNASGAAPAAREACDVLLVDAGAQAPAPSPGDPPALVLLAPEQRDRIEPLRAQGYAGYLIKPLRRTSLAERILAVGRPAAAGCGVGQDERARPRDGSSGLRVLLAEDNPVNALLARALLTRAGCTVDRAATGQEAVTAALAQPYDLILMDMRMPGMSGLDAARTLRAEGCTTSITALTANAFDDDRRACREAGMDGFLTKPLDPAALEATLARLRLYLDPCEAGLR